MLVVGTSSTFMTRGLSGCLPGKSGSTHAFVAPIDQVTVGEGVTGHVDVIASDVADDNADVTDRDLGQRHFFDYHQPRVEVPRASEQDLLLQATANPFPTNA